MTTIIDTITDFYFDLINHKMVVPETVNNYKQTFYDFCNLYGLKETKNINANHIIKYRNYIATRQCRKKTQTGLSERSVYANMNRLKAYFKWLFEKWLLEDIKLCEFPINKIGSTNPSHLTKAELKFIFKELDKLIEQNGYALKKRDYQYASYQLRAMIHLLYATGLRNSELRKLKPDGIDINNLTGTVIGKGAKQNNFTFNSQAKKALIDYLVIKEKYYGNSSSHMEYLFTSANFWTQITSTGLNVALQNFWKKIGLEKKLHAHVFRHTCATTLLNNGADIKTVQQKLCHVSIETTAIYLHISDEQLKKATSKLAIY